MKLLSFVPAAATTDRDAAITVERSKLEVPVAEAPWR
jgi:hypothetical protein